MYAQFFHSVEFYVIAAVMAAAVVALSVRPPRRGPVITRLLSSAIGPDVHADDQSVAPRLLIKCDDEANVIITRTGVTGSQAINLAVTVNGHDVNIEESAIPGPNPDSQASATFVIDFLGRDRYFFTYTAARQSLFAALQFTVKPGLKIEKTLTVS